MRVLHRLLIPAVFSREMPTICRALLNYLFLGSIAMRKQVAVLQQKRPLTQSTTAHKQQQVYVPSSHPPLPLAHPRSKL